MRRRIEDPNQLNIEFPEENKEVTNDKPEIFDVNQDKDTDLRESQKIQEEVLHDIRTSFPARTEDERDDDNDYVRNYNVSWKDIKRNTKKDVLIFDEEAISLLKEAINSFKSGIVSDIMFNANLEDRNEAGNFDRINKKILEYERYGDKERVGILKTDKNILEKVGEIINLLDKNKHTEFIKYIESLKNISGGDCLVIVKSKQYDELMDIIRQNRR